jgi:hypothetical protein
VDLGALPTLDGAVHQLASALPTTDQRVVSRARAHAPSYSSILGEDDPPPCFDLACFADLIL